MEDKKIARQTKLEQKYNKWIVVFSVAIPVFVALLFGINLQKLGFDIKPLSFLPPIYASINGVTAIVLIISVWAVKNGKQKMHENLMKIAIFLSLCFLIMYVAYHMTSEPTKFGGKGAVRYIYYFILITHITLSVIVIPFVLFTYIRALAKRFDKHRKLAKITFPVWLYVAITGVIVYLMILPYCTN